MTVEFVPFASVPRLGLVSCDARDGDKFGPIGHHLRWFVAASVGFPAAGFDVMHIEQALWEARRRDIWDVADLAGVTGWTSALNWSHRDRHHPVHGAAVIVTGADATLQPTSSGLRVAAAGRNRHLLIHFNEPVIHVRLELRARRPRSPRDVSGRTERNGRIDVRHGAARIDAVDLGPVVEIERPGITDLLVPNTIEAIGSLSFVREAAAAELAQRSGRHLAHIDLPRSVRQAHDLAAVEKGIRNRLFVGASLSELRKRYPSNLVRDLVARLGSTIGEPQRTVHAPGGPELAPADIRVLDHLRLAAIDPNVARMLASYWVDPSPEAGLYVVRGDHADPAKTVSLGFTFSRHAADVPKLERVTAEQLPGIEFSGATPLGRAGLRIQRHEGSIDAPRPVMLDVRRRAEGTVVWLTEQRLQLVTTGTDLQVTDRRLPVPESYSWEVTPIDVFGRSGDPSETDKLTMVDLERPVPPRHLVASLEQHGAPWLDPSQRDADLDRTGAIAATAEFAEAQWTIAPDATELRWCWRPGHDGAANRAPAAWQILHDSPIERPAALAFTWGGEHRLTAYPLTVADGRIRDGGRDASMLERLDPITRNALDAVPPQPDLVEVLLQVALLEPDLFAGHEIEIDGEKVSVIGSTAGIAADDDTTGDRRFTARLFLGVTDATERITRGDVLIVTHPLGRDWKPGLAHPDGGGSDIPPPLIELPLPEQVRPARRAEGGEVAIDLRFAAPTSGALPTPADHDDVSADRTTIVGRVVADHLWPIDVADRRTPTRRSVLVRVRPADADRLIQIERLGLQIAAVARHHRPYVMPITSLGLDGASGDVAIDLGPDDRFSTFWVSAYVVDEGGKESAQVATPAELRAVRPPLTAAMAAPYPEHGGPAAQRGQLSLPDVDGESTVAVAWPLPDVGTAAAHVRYELGRALASTIVATDRDRWMRGGVLGGAAALGVVDGPSVELTVRSDYRVHHDNGTVSVRVDTPSDAQASTLRSITSGRVRIGTPSTGTHHRLAKIATVAGGPDDGAVEILFRPSVDATSSSMDRDPTGTTCTLDGTPDYTAVIADDDLVRQLADLPGSGTDDSNERAFGLVTGVPIEGLRFVDRLAGRGRSRFFYKVRAVFPGETRSSWSPCSVAFHQVDATVAEPPIDLQVAPDGRLATFRLPDDPLVIGVGVTTSVDGEVVDDRRVVIDGTDPSTTLRAARLTSRRGLVDLSAALGSAPFADPVTPPPVIGVYPADVDRTDPPADANLLGDDPGAQPVARSIAVPREFDGTPLAIRLADGSGERWVDAIPGRFEVDLGDDTSSDTGDDLSGHTGDPAARYALRSLKLVAIRTRNTTFEVAFDSAAISLDPRGVADALGG